ncbi:MAG: DUF4349 domain-containing protein [Dehalococcoidia bacterium]|nr:MAG: DUF4349 domain-containing protein [Dehalococcoidia bacterium]
MKKLVVILLLTVLLVVPAACAGRAPEDNNLGTDQSGITFPGVAPAPSEGKGGFEMPEPSPTTPPAFDISDSSASAATESMIVRTANMSLIVEDVARIIDQISNLAKTNDGYVVTSGVWRSGERLVGSISIRVAVGSFDATILALRGMAAEVTSETTSSRDVTEEYVDLEAKLRNLQAAEEQLLRLMDRAEKVEDILAIQRELTRVRGEIEQTQGRMQYLERTSSSSLIDISLQESRLSVKFNASNNAVKTGQTIRFAPEVSGGFTPYSYAWEFGDGRTSTSLSPTHQYTSRGSYTVSLKVTDDKGNTAEETRENYITVTSSWAPGNVASNAWNALGGFGRGLVNVLIWVGIFSPVWIIIGAFVWWLTHRRKKKAAR